ncbi:haloacid dehalogenase-like hydrolase family protein [Trichomonas vaginalis G3]|uniref:Haloacid dehalogenase-like hydrolase family protein n=1 Tax=Trichomonas vaginalis (strain ATCC PRA-98 / G3) TaxID=412133 RepID=A2FPH0_TRIV3|nr:HAD-like family [Trichomonas vaginalis G3]EAX93205.1 haloacid dehalogenase-like hydrolase family protein [Trichomonas vaginalis G3]KAI5540028.1 HAD-like family [Trichomonas vaginalis G3]|eukprot:XP_001306135.1 haloacid dehalogenase-like hydrolase family protein [Trichomonas vaginalis G3]
MTRQVLLIDLDDTIYPQDWIPLEIIVESVVKTLKEYGYSQKDIDDQSNVGGAGIFNWALRVLKGDLVKFDQFCIDVYKKIDYSTIKRDDHLYSLLQKASEKFDIYIATNNTRVHVEKICELHFGHSLNTACFGCIDIKDTYFDGVFHPKQTPGNLAVYAKLAKTEPSNCILLDDSYPNIKNAKALGMKAEAITKQYTLAIALEKLLQD